MPGIVGLITKMPSEHAISQAERMIRTLVHETFYDMGMWVERSLGVYVGWVSRQGSFCEKMPLRNERGDVILVFSGEEFPEPGTTQRLKEKGHKVDASGPNYLAHLYEDDPSFPKGLNGRFQGLVVDHSRGTAVLFNDRYGLHRLYYHQSKNAFYFAAEAKAILAVCPETRRMPPQSLGEFIACGSVLENRTLFESVQLLPSASAWVFRNGALDQKSSYFHPREWDEQETLDPESCYRELRQAFARNLPRYFAGDQPVAMSMTGGLDTRMIMAWRRPQPGSLACYTFGGMRRECRDVSVARQLAQACGQSHEVIEVGKEFLSRFSHYAERTVYLTDGCADVGRAPDLYLNERAREIAPIRMTGNYGGEVLRRVRAFKPVKPPPGLFQADVLPDLYAAAETYSGLLREHPVSFAVFKQAPWHHYGILALEETQLSLRSPYLDNDFVRTLFRAPLATFATTDVSLRLIWDGNRSLLQIPTDRGLAGEKGRLSAAASRAVLEFLFKAEYAYDMGMPQWLAQVDRMLSPLRLERLFLGRHKIFHFRTWYRDALASYVRELLLDALSLSRPYIERKGVETAVRGHLQGNRNFTNEIHKLLTLEILHRLFLDHAEGGGALKYARLRVDNLAYCGTA